MCSIKEFLKEEKKQQYCFTTIPKGLRIYRPTEDIMKNAGEVLLKFKGIMVDGTLLGLLSIRIISHHIDLILGSSLPKEAPHRMTLMENIELNH